MRLLTISLIIFSLLLVSCGGLPDRPDTNLCIFNFKLMHKKCYNMARDYDDSGELLPNAKPSIVPISGLADLDKNTCIDPDSTANLKVYLDALRKKAAEQ